MCVVANPIFGVFRTETVSCVIMDSASSSTTARSDVSSSIQSEELLTINDNILHEDGVSQIFQRRSVLHEDLTGGWSKKAVRRSQGHWNVFLVSPDNKIIRNQSDLKLYVAKSGAILDSNIINFSLPHKTSLMESAISEISSDDGSVRSKRTVKTPSKFSDFKASKGSIFAKREEETSPTKSSPPTPAKITPTSRSLSSNTSRRSVEDHVCLECNKMFSKKSHLDEHLLIHAGTKPFACSTCGWTFRRQDKLKKHLADCTGVNKDRGTHQVSQIISFEKFSSEIIFS